MKIALVGATGVVGEQILEQFTQRSFQFRELRLFASANSDDDLIEFGGESLAVRDLSADAFDGVDLAIFATPASVSLDWCPVAKAAGSICIDLSAACPEGVDNLLVAGVNSGMLTGAMISTPASLTVQLALLLDTLGQVAELRSILVTRFSPASAQGRKGLDELQKQAGELLNGRPANPQVFPAQLAFNGIPAVNADQDRGLADELATVLGTPDLNIHINSLQLPLFYGEGAFVRVEFSSLVSTEKIRKAISSAEALTLIEQPPMPTFVDAIGAEEILVSLCPPQVEPSMTFDFWSVADNIGRCAAGNVVCLAEILAARIKG